MKISAILRGKGSQIVSVGPHDPLSVIVRTLAQHRIGAVLVRDTAGSMLGILSERDVVRALASQADRTFNCTAVQLMTQVRVTVTPDTAVETGLELMTENRVRHLPVLEEGRLAGFVSIGDLVKARIDQAEHEAAELRNYVAG